MEENKWMLLASPAVVVKIISALRNYALLVIYFFYRAYNRMETDSILGNINLFYDFLLNVLPAFLIVLAGIMEYRKFRYKLSPENLRIEEGWLRREKKVIPIDKIQSVQIEQNLLYRYLNIYLVKIDTIGESSVEVEIGGVLKKEAYEIKNKVQQLKQSVTETEEEQEEREERESDEIPYALDNNQVFRYALTENIFWILTPLVLSGVLIYRLFEASDLENIDIGLIFQLIFGDFGQLGNGSGPDQSLSYIVLYGLVFGTFSSAMVFLNRITGLFNFKLFLRSSEIFIQRGLINKFETIIPHRKVQYVTWYTNLLRKRLGIYTFNYRFSGNRRTLGANSIIPFFDEKQINMFLLPYLKYGKPELESAIDIEEEIHTEDELHLEKGLQVEEGLYAEEELTFEEELQVEEELQAEGVQEAGFLSEGFEETEISHGISKSYIYRNFLLAKLPVAAVLITLAYFIHVYLFYVAFLIPIYFFIHNVIYVRNYRIYFRKDDIIIRKGVWGLRTTVLKWEKIQKVSFFQTPYQQRADLANLTLGTASSSIGVPYLDLHIAEQIKDYGLYRTERSNQFLF